MDSKVLFFDCFGVLISEVSDIWTRRYFSDDEIRRIETTIAAKVNTNQISGDEFYKELSIMSGVAPNQIMREWTELVRVDDKIVDLVDNCRERHYKTALLSNAFNPFLRDILRANDLEKHFDDIIISCEVGVQKPDPRIFALAMERLHTSPAESIFIDDRTDNIRSARSFGIDGILYESYEQLVRDLTTRNIA